MEAADDICYRIVDLEDGFRLHRISYNTAEALLRDIASDASEQRLKELTDPHSKISYLRALAIGALIEQATDVFADHEEQILGGKFDSDLLSLAPSSGTLESIKKEMKKSVYSAQGVLETEAAGFQIIPGLLDLFWGAVSADKTQKSYRRAYKVLDLIPNEFRGPKGKSREAAHERMLRITDYVTGMTDSYALALYRKLNGIALPT